MSDTDYITTERVALLVFTLTRGGTVTTREIAERLEITENGAWRMLSRVSRVLPVVQDKGQWFLLQE
jgi:predicted ArsR family transcriptional regulator